MLTLESESSLSMDASSSPAPEAPDLPRNLYFGAEDWVALQPNIKDHDLALVRNQRHALVGHVTHKAERLIVSVKALRDFDGTGNAGDTLAHIEALRDDLIKLTTNLINEVEDAEVRYETAQRVPRGPEFDRVFLDETVTFVREEPSPDVKVVEDPTPSTPAAVEPTPQAPRASGPKPSPGLAAANRRDKILFGVRA